MRLSRAGGVCYSAPDYVSSENPKGNDFRMSAHVFREYDIRAVADRDLDDAFVERIGRGLAELLRPAAESRAPRIAVARDCRLSGPRIFAALVKGLVAGGA